MIDVKIPSSILYADRLLISIGDVDGLIGDRTRQAIRQEQLRFGLSPTGRAGQLFLNAIRDENAKKIMK